jgi:transposase
MNTEPSLSLGLARVKRPQRHQVKWRPVSLDQCLPSDHQARLVWQYVDSLDLSALYHKIKAVTGAVGRDAVDPKILLALWMFATIEGVSSARQIARLCERDLAYQWICGDVGVNYHLLSDFRSLHGEVLDQLLTATIATLLHQDLIKLETVAQDGMRVRAGAGGSSFRRRATLKECHHQAERQVQQLREEREQEVDPAESNKRRAAAQQRAARDREARLSQALTELDKLQEQKKSHRKPAKNEDRISTTDPEARKMKMADGGYRPAYNVQLGSDGTARMIVSVDVTNSGSDSGKMATMHADIVERYDKTPQHYLVDGGFNSKDDITALEQRGTQVYTPIHSEQQMLERGKDPYAKQEGDSPEMVTYRQRMKTAAAKTLYKQRPSIAEYPNAEFRNRGLRQFRIRGLAKVKATALLQALTFNFLRMCQLGWIDQLAVTGP